METKTAVQARFEAIQAQMIALSHRIHAHPEIGFEEEQASTWLCEVLTAAGFHVDKGICDLPTAFRASAGHGPLHLVICAEYDSLPGVGHACGHNIIAAMSVGASIGRVPGACGYYFGTSPKPSVSSDPAGYQPSKSVFNLSLAPVGLCLYALSPFIPPILHQYPVLGQLHLKPRWHAVAQHLCE